tara:strand:- start:890 stop:1507 length:618 start_codon:yes stop_codon:yes gene_type:complete
MKNNIIGISGVAGAGKDLFYELLSQQVKCRRFSLGDELKKEIRSYCIDNFSIDPLTCSRPEKNLIRKCLVSHASIKRQLSEGRYWLEKVDPQIKNHIFEQLLLGGGVNEYSCITDIRYNQYKNDEVYWLKEQLGGILVHISQFKIINSQKIFTPPANEDEASQDSMLKENADYVYECQFIEGPLHHVKKTLSNSVIKDFLQCIKK